EKQKGSRGIRRGQWYRLVFQFPIRELEKLFAVMKTEAHLNYQVALENVLSAEYEVDGIFRKVAFSELELHEQKQLLIEILDKNQLYVNASDMDDSDLNISESDKAFTRSFYGME
ncbi:hypothetical protein LNT29_27420, partial [Klebsiella pneumoniae]|nr:hypothetical protein [Klebsiella pneumoniae]